jgi:glycosyltransferase involved in cell wall biosynthesis
VRIALVDPSNYTLPYDHHLASALARRGHDVELLAAPFPFGSPPEPDGYLRSELFFVRSGPLLRRSPRSPLRFAAKGIEYLPSARRLLRRVDELDPDVVHVQWLPYPALDRRWLRALARKGPVVFTAHDVLPQRSEDRVELWRDVFATANRTVVHSEAARERLVALGIEPGKLAVVPHAVFPARGAVGPPAGRSLLFFGLIRRSKGLDLLLRALPHVPGARLVVAGDALEPAEPYRELAGQLGVADRIEWRLRFVGDEEAEELMASAAIVVLPYRRIESSGVLATALGHGRPVVVTDVGSLGDTVREFGAGLVVPPEDSAALAEACRSLLDDAAALQAAFEGTRRAASVLSWDAAADAHERIYEEIARR